MAIQWGAWRRSGGNGMRVGIDMSWSKVGTNSSSVTATVRYYTQNQYSYSDSQSLNFSGAIGGSKSYYNGAGGGVVHRATRQYTYNYGPNQYGSSPGNRTFSVTVNGAYNGVTPSQSITRRIPARPYAPAYRPSSVDSERINDDRIAVTWVANESAQRPVSSHTIQRRVYAGSSWGSWRTVATVGGARSGMYFTGLSANRVYQFRVRSSNSAGPSANWTNGPWVRMTPTSPSNVRAAVNTAGDQITLRWSNRAYDLPADVGFQIERSTDGGSSWTVMEQHLSQPAESWTDTAPNAGENLYRIRAEMVRSGVPSLTGGWIQSNTVSTIVPPLQPTELSPDGRPVDVEAEDLVLSWQHNDGGDGADQSHYSIRYSEDGGDTWTFLTGFEESSESEHVVPAGTLLNGVTYTWQVMTRGSTLESFGPWSATATILAASKPTLALVEPADESTVAGLPVTVEWVYAQDEGQPQTRWIVVLLEQGSLRVLDMWGDANEATTFTLDHDFVDEGQYVVRLQVQSADGIWSNIAEAEFTVDLLPPAPVDLAAIYDPCTGVAVLNLDPQEPEPGVTSTVDHLNIERRIDGGEWVMLVQDIPASEQYDEAFSERFDEDVGGFEGNNEFGDYSVPASVTQSPGPPTPTQGSFVLDIEWDAPGDPLTQNVVTPAMDESEADQPYTLVMRVWNESAASVRPKVSFLADGDPIPALAEWQTVTLPFTTNGGAIYAGLRNDDPQAGQHTYVDEVAVYVGDATGFNGEVLAPTSLLDTIPQVAGTNEYRLRNTSINGSVEVSEPVVMEGTDAERENQWVFVSYGPGFDRVLRFRGDPSISASTTRSRSATPYLGARLPHLQVGNQVTRVLSVSGTLNYDYTCEEMDPTDCTHDSPRDDWEEMSWEAEMVCYRDYTGRRIFGMLGDVSTEDVRPGFATVSFSVEEVRREELPGSGDAEVEVVL